MNSAITLVALTLPLAGWEAYLRLFEAAGIRHYTDALAQRKTEAVHLLQGPSSELTDRVRLHPFYGYTGSPHLPGIDRYGFRNTHDMNWLSPLADTMIVGFTGGSAAAGYGIARAADTIQAKLEARLNTDFPRRRWVVLNLAVGGWHYPQQFVVVSRFIARLDLVITYDGFNDLFIPLRNTLGETPSVPPDFPLYFSTLARPSGSLTLARYAQLQADTSWNPG